MVRTAQNPWESQDLSALVSIGTHALWLSTSGLPRKFGRPVVIMMTGGGAPAAAYIRLQRLLSKFARVYFYDRAGYGFSESAPTRNPNAEDASRDLVALMKAVGVGPPYVIVAHSYSGMIARTFTAMYRWAVSGLVLVDCATELLQAVVPNGIPGKAFAAVTEGVDYDAVTHLREECKLDDSEWDAMIHAYELTSRKQRENPEGTRDTGHRLAERYQFERQAFGRLKVSVMSLELDREFRALFEKGVEMGNGTEEQREEVRRMLETFRLFGPQIKYAQMRLSSRSRWVSLPQCGHDMPIRNPEFVAREVGLVLD